MVCHIITDKRREKKEEEENCKLQDSTKMFRISCTKIGIRDNVFSFNFLESLQKAVFPFAPLHTQVLDRSLALKTNKPPYEETYKKTNRLAIIFAWMLAKGKHIDRYSNLYLQQDFDVLTVNITPKELMIPTTGSQVIAQKVLDYLESHPEYEKVIVHALSVGVYLFGECLVKMEDNSSRYAPLMNRFAGIVCDSGIDYYGIPEGLSKAMFQSPFVSGFAQRGIDLYMRLFYNMSTKHYIRSSQAFHNNYLPCPALFLMSKNDIVASVKAQEDIMNKWVNKGIDGRIKCWEKSKHVSHFHTHPEEYCTEICGLLKKAGLLNN